MNKLEELISLCKCSVSLYINPHKSTDETISEYFFRAFCGETNNAVAVVGKELFEEIVKQNNLIELVFYPYTHLSFFHLYHYDLDKILDTALEMIKTGGGE